MYQAVFSGKISGNGIFTQKCQDFFRSKYGFKMCLLTTSCTDALEMAALLIDTKQGDEIIMPSYTFVSTANAFVLRGARIVFVDSTKENPNMDVSQIEALITPRTRAIVPVHYAGIACDMDKIMELSSKYDLVVVEDAAQAIDSFYRGRPLGSIGHLAAFSFHETKNVISGEGGMLVVNDARYERRAEIIWEKGTNRSAFWRGEVDKYGWVDIGSSFLPSEIIAAFLYAQLENLDDIQQTRQRHWQQYCEGLKPLEAEGLLRLPVIPSYATNNGHMFYLICRNGNERDRLLGHLKKNGILAVFHYLSLHRSPFYAAKHDGREIPLSDLYTNCLVRLPLFYELSLENIKAIIEIINRFYETL